jgi:hypothetical protein
MSDHEELEDYADGPPRRPWPQVYKIAVTIALGQAVYFSTVIVARMMLEIR